MNQKNRFAIAFAISAGVAFGVFAFAPASQTIYVKNGGANYSASADASKPVNTDGNASAGQIGDLSNNIIPSIRATQNITDNFAAALTRELISKNSTPQTDPASNQPALNMPSADSIAQKFVADGLNQANQNILNITQPNLIVSNDNNKAAIEKYLADAQTVINDNLKNSGNLFDLLNEINQNNGAGKEKLAPIAAAHEAAADQLEKIPVPSKLKDLMAEEIRLLRITANILKELVNIDSDPLGGLAATKQFEAVMQNWNDLQNKFNALIGKL